MKKSTYIITLLLSILVPSLAASASEMKDDEKTGLPYDINSTEPIPLDMKPYEKWPKNREMVYSPRLFGSQGFEDIVNTKDERKKMRNLDLQISIYKAPASIAKYIVKIHSYYGPIMGKEIAGEGTATIIKKEKGIIYLLTCAHNVVKYEDLDPFNPESKVSYFFAKSIYFSYQEKRYLCNKYYIYPHYNEKNNNKDIAIIVSHRGFESLPYPGRDIFYFDCFPKISSSSLKKYDGYIIGYPGEKEKRNDLYGMSGHLNILGDFIEYDSIDTSKGQSGSPILAKINGVYKIIGVHTIMGITSNWGICISKDMIEWEKGCWIKTKKLYNNNLKIFSLKKNMKIVLGQQKLDIDIKSVYKLTPFLHASKNSKLFALKILQEKGANVNVTDGSGRNALHLAIRNNKYYEVIEWLVNVAKVNIHAKDRWGETPFLWSAKNGKLPALKFFKEKGADVHAIDENAENALHLAIIWSQNYEVIEWLVNVAKVNVNTKNKDGITPFLYAAKQCNLPVLKLLKEKGANANATDEYGKNSLYWATQHNEDYKVIEWLVNVAKVNVNTKNKWGKKPFFCAAEKGNLPVLKLLKEKGANVQASDRYGYNVLHLAIENNANYGVIEWLVNTAKVNVNAKGGYWQRTPFLYAAKEGNLPVLKLLKEKGADVETTDKDGENTLHLAIAWSQDYEVIEWLVSVAKVNVNTKNKWGKKPFFYAAEKGNLPVLKLLKEKGANVNATNEDGQNDLSYTRYWEDDEMIIS